MGLADVLERNKFGILNAIKKLGDSPESLYKAKRLKLDNGDVLIDMFASYSSRQELWLSVASDEVAGLDSLVAGSEEWIDTIEPGVYQDPEKYFTIRPKGNTVRIEYWEERKEPFTNQEYAAHMCDLIDKVISLLKAKQSVKPEEYKASPESGIVDYESPEALAEAIKSGEHSIYKNLTTFLIGGREASVSIVDIKTGK